MTPSIATQPPAAAARADRIQALDFTKGMLVLIMVLYHWLNYFVGPDGYFYRYLRFLTPSFIFITGFFISHVYLRKYDLRASRLPVRLLSRGMKLLGVFVVLNVAASLISFGSVAAAGMLFTTSSLLSVYATGNTAHVAAFSILVPISYLLLLSAALVIAARFYTQVFHAASISVFICALALAFAGVNNAYVELLSIGLIGVSCGSVPPKVLHASLDQPALLLLAYSVYLCLITLWREEFALQIVGVGLSLALLYVLGQRANGRSRASGIVVLLGKYSLLGYIAQIFVLQALRRGLPHVTSGIPLLGLSFAAGLVLTVISVYAVDRIRLKAPVFNRLYAAVFA